MQSTPFGSSFENTKQLKAALNCSPQGPCAIPPKHGQSQLISPVSSLKAPCCSASSSSASGPPTAACSPSAGVGAGAGDEDAGTGLAWEVSSCDRACALLCSAIESTVEKLSAPLAVSSGTCAPGNRQSLRLFHYSRQAELTIWLIRKDSRGIIVVHNRSRSRPSQRRTFPCSCPPCRCARKSPPNWSFWNRSRDCRCPERRPKHARLH